MGESGEIVGVAYGEIYGNNHRGGLMEDLRLATYIYIYIYTHTYIYIYTYIERGRKRDEGRDPIV